MIRRIQQFATVFGSDDPLVYILAPSAEKPTPAGDTRRGTVWIFRDLNDASRFAAWMHERNNVLAVPVQIVLRQLTSALADKDLTYVLDPEPKPGYGDPYAFKAPLPQ